MEKDTTAQPESAISAMEADTSAHHCQREQLNPGTSASDAKAADTCHPAQGTSESRSEEQSQSSLHARGAEGQDVISKMNECFKPLDIPPEIESWSKLFAGVGPQFSTESDRPFRTVLHGTNVDHPDHYNAGGIECIDAMEAAATPEEFRGFCKLNALKYLWRERGKNGNEDLEKATWYLNRAVEASKREKAK